MSLWIPVLLFIGCVVSGLLAGILIVGTGARDAFLLYNRSMVPSLHKPSWGHIICYFLGIIFLVLANIAWPAGIITLVIWAVLTLA